MGKDKNIYELLNEMDFDIEEYEKEELNDLEKEKLKNNFNESREKKFNFKRFGSIAVSLLLTIGVLSQTSLGKEVYATTESKLSEITYSIANALGIERDIAKYSNVINKTIENNGVEVKLTDVIIDKDEFIFSTIINTNNPADGVDFDYDIFINGKKARLYGASGGSRKIDDSEELFSTDYAVDVKDIDIKEDLDVRIVLKNLSYYTYGEDEWSEDLNKITNKIRGKWDFKFNASGNELTANTYLLPLDYSFNIGEQNYKLEEFRYNPVNQKIYGKIENIDVNNSNDIELRGYDDLGNKVEFYLSTSDKKSFILKYSNLVGDLSDKVTSITLVPYAVEYPKKSGKMPNNYKVVGEEFIIFLK